MPFHKVFPATYLTFVLIQFYHMMGMFMHKNLIFIGIKLQYTVIFINDSFNLNN